MFEHYFQQPGTSPEIMGKLMAMIVAYIRAFGQSPYRLEEFSFSLLFGFRSLPAAYVTQLVDVFWKTIFPSFSDPFLLVPLVCRALLGYLASPEGLAAGAALPPGGGAAPAGGSVPAMTPQSVPPSGGFPIGSEAVGATGGPGQPGPVLFSSLFDYMFLLDHTRFAITILQLIACSSPTQCVHPCGSSSATGPKPRLQDIRRCTAQCRPLLNGPPPGLHRAVPAPTPEERVMGGVQAILQWYLDPARTRTRLLAARNPAALLAGTATRRPLAALGSSGRARDFFMGTAQISAATAALSAQQHQQQDEAALAQLVTLESSFVVPYLEEVLKAHTETLCECLMPPRQWIDIVPAAPAPQQPAEDLCRGTYGAPLNQEGPLEPSRAAARHAYLNSEEVSVLCGVLVRLAGRPTFVPVVEYVFLDWLQELAIDPNESFDVLSAYTKETVLPPARPSTPPVGSLFRSLSSRDAGPGAGPEARFDFLLAQFVRLSPTDLEALEDLVISRHAHPCGAGRAEEAYQRSLTDLTSSRNAIRWLQLLTQAGASFAPEFLGQLLSPTAPLAHTNAILMLALDYFYGGMARTPRTGLHLGATEAAAERAAGAGASLCEELAPLLRTIAHLHQDLPRRDGRASVLFTEAGYELFVELSCELLLLYCGFPGGTFFPALCPVPHAAWPRPPRGPPPCSRGGRPGDRPGAAEGGRPWPAGPPRGAGAGGEWTRVSNQAQFLESLLPFLFQRLWEMLDGRFDGVHDLLLGLLGRTCHVAPLYLHTAITGALEQEMPAARLQAVERVGRLVALLPPSGLPFPSFNPAADPALPTEAPVPGDSSSRPAGLGPVPGAPPPVRYHLLAPARPLPLRSPAFASPATFGQADPRLLQYSPDPLPLGSPLVVALGGPGASSLLAAPTAPNREALLIPHTAGGSSSSSSGGGGASVGGPRSGGGTVAAASRLPISSRPPHTIGLATPLVEDLHPAFGLALSVLLRAASSDPHHMVRQAARQVLQSVGWPHVATGLDCLARLVIARALEPFAAPTAAASGPRPAPAQQPQPQQATLADLTRVLTPLSPPDGRPARPPQPAPAPPDEYAIGTDYAPAAGGLPAPRPIRGAQPGQQQQQAQGSGPLPEASRGRLEDAGGDEEEQPAEAMAATAGPAAMMVATQPRQLPQSAAAPAAPAGDVTAQAQQAVAALYEWGPGSEPPTAVDPWDAQNLAALGASDEEDPDAPPNPVAGAAFCTRVGQQLLWLARAYPQHQVLPWPYIFYELLYSPPDPHGVTLARSNYKLLLFTIATQQLLNRVPTGPAEMRHYLRCVRAFAPTYPPRAAVARVVATLLKPTPPPALAPGPLGGSLEPTGPQQQQQQQQPLPLSLPLPGSAETAAAPGGGLAGALGGSQPGALEGEGLLDEDELEEVAALLARAGKQQAAPVSAAPQAPRRGVAAVRWPVAHPELVQDWALRSVLEVLTHNAPLAPILYGHLLLWYRRVLAAVTELLYPVVHSPGPQPRDAPLSQWAWNHRAMLARWMALVETATLENEWLLTTPQPHLVAAVDQLRVLLSVPEPAPQGIPNACSLPPADLQAIQVSACRLLEAVLRRCPNIECKVPQLTTALMRLHLRAAGKALAGAPQRVPHCDGLAHHTLAVLAALVRVYSAQLLMLLAQNDWAKEGFTMHQVLTVLVALTTGHSPFGAPVGGVFHPVLFIQQLIASYPANLATQGSIEHRRSLHLLSLYIHAVCHANRWWGVPTTPAGLNALGQVDLDAEFRPFMEPPIVQQIHGFIGAQWKGWTALPAALPGTPPALAEMVQAGPLELPGLLLQLIAATREAALPQAVAAATTGPTAFKALPKILRGMLKGGVEKAPDPWQPALGLLPTAPGVPLAAPGPQLAPQLASGLLGLSADYLSIAAEAMDHVGLLARALLTTAEKGLDKEITGGDVSRVQLSALYGYLQAFAGEEWAWDGLYLAPFAQPAPLPGTPAPAPARFGLTATSPLTQLFLCRPALAVDLAPLVAAEWRLPPLPACPEGTPHWPGREFALPWANWDPAFGVPLEPHDVRQAAARLLVRFGVSSVASALHAAALPPTPGAAPLAPAAPGEPAPSLASRLWREALLPPMDALFKAPRRLAGWLDALQRILLEAIQMGVPLVGSLLPDPTQLMPYILNGYALYHEPAVPPAVPLLATAARTLASQPALQALLSVRLLSGLRAVLLHTAAYSAQLQVTQAAQQGAGGPTTTEGLVQRMGEALGVDPAPGRPLEMDQRVMARPPAGPLPSGEAASDVVLGLCLGVDYALRRSVLPPGGSANYLWLPFLRYVRLMERLQPGVATLQLAPQWVRDCDRLAEGVEQLAAAAPQQGPLVELLRGLLAQIREGAKQKLPPPAPVAALAREMAEEIARGW
ncbi:hypothetical protein PAPYR_3145 [Paratrimastix pyriformis]|uniref:Non-specific serine/threonine protein kinase n=1 Tax=Paratrimastix pyriformis TaxID=342808 RepID=A0ABQ8UMX0_9EUKA|nr:hypothetical protein PAPYR_3145 [Paratrimastix pyriformis]